MAAKTIWKYPLYEPTSTVTMPLGAKILSMQMQHDVPTLWVLCDPDNEQVTRVFEAIPTGGTVNDEDGYNYRGTAQFSNGLVFHIFEVSHG
jgi:hypothetical protein